MTARRAIATTVALAVAMLLIGGIGLFKTEPTQAAGPHVRFDESDLTPAGGGRSIDATIASLQAQVAKHPDEPRLSAQLGLAYLQKGRLTADPSYYPKAQSLFQRALESDTGTFEALVGQGLLANARHRFAAALRWGRAAARVNRFSAPALGVVADAEIELGRYKAAERTIQHMVDLKPDLSSFARVAYYRELTGDVSGAVAAMRLALRATGPVGDDASWVRTQIGDLYFNSGRPKDAEEMYRSALKVAPSSLGAGAGLARVLASRGRLGAAVRRMQDVTLAYPTPQNVITLGDLYTAAGRRSEAEEQYALVQAGRRLFTTAGVVPDVELTVFYADHGLRPRATVRLARSQYEARSGIRTADALAWALHSVGRSDEALRYADQALSLGTRDATYHYHRGAILLALGRSHDAASELRGALGINPHFSVLGAEHARSLLREATK